MLNVDCRMLNEDLKTFDVAVVGAGAAGLMAAIFAGRCGARVIAVDAAPSIGKKILISGGGRCNVTHDVVSAADFNGNRNAIAKVLRTFDVPATVVFFEELGVRLKREETGKLFPVSDRARDVVDALLRAETFESVDAALVDNARAFLRRRLPDRLIEQLAPAGKLTKEQRRRVAHDLVDFPIPVIRDRGFDFAEVTAGGVPLPEVDVRT